MAKKTQKKLYRSKKDKMVAGVCGGIGEYTETDATLIRLLYAILTIFTGFFPGIILYLVAWIIVPEK